MFGSCGPCVGSCGPCIGSCGPCVGSSVPCLGHADHVWVIRTVFGSCGPCVGSSVPCLGHADHVWVIRSQEPPARTPGVLAECLVLKPPPANRPGLPTHYSSSSYYLRSQIRDRLPRSWKSILPVSR
ncbi:MAG: hypothetical protein GY940_25390 [bacterium]|nr:hypothetical protein [bacterium]